MCVRALQHIVLSFNTLAFINHWFLSIGKKKFCIIYTQPRSTFSHTEDNTSPYEYSHCEMCNTLKQKTWRKHSSSEEEKMNWFVKKAPPNRFYMWKSIFCSGCCAYECTYVHEYVKCKAPESLRSHYLHINVSKWPELLLQWIYTFCRSYCDNIK